MSGAVGWGIVRGYSWSSPTPPHGGERDPINDWAKIRFGSGIDNGPLETAPRLNRREVLLEEHAHVRGREVNSLLESEVVHNCVFG